MKRTWLFVALINFLIAATLGALLRLAFVIELPWIRYKYVLHAHSHVAMLGWIYLALFALLVHIFVPERSPLSSTFNRLFWATEISVLGMLFSFPFQGYGPVSIAFSMMHIFCSYLFVWRLWKVLPATAAFSVRMAKTAMIFMVFSTLGIWLMGPILATPLRHSSFYHMAVQFYLHFQFNGWFLFAALALFFKLSENRNILFPPKKINYFFWFLVVSCLLTYALAVVWTTSLDPVLLANSIGVLLQMSALILFLQLIWPRRKDHRQIFTGTERTLLAIAFIAFSLKIIVQTFVAIPLVAEAAYTIRNYIIGFIHLILLGAITFYILSFALRENLLTGRNFLARWGISLLASGFILSELLLFLQGSMLWTSLGFLPYYYEALFGASVLMPLGVSGVISGQFLSQK